MLDNSRYIEVSRARDEVELRRMLSDHAHKAFMAL